MASNTGAVNTTGYQLLPRLYADFIQGLTPNLVGVPTTANITASLSSGQMRAYFNNPVDNTLALPGNNAVYLPRATSPTRWPATSTGPAKPLTSPSITGTAA